MAMRLSGRNMKKKKPTKVNLTSFARIYVFIAIIISLATLMIQMHVLDSHKIELPSGNLSPSLSSESIQDLQTQTKNIPRRSNKSRYSGDDGECSDIIDDEDDEDLKPILELLCEAGIDVSRNSKQIDRSALPKWSKIVDFYGPPKILGLDSCERFRDTVAPKRRRMAAAGIFNSGTNLLGALLDSNCYGKRGTSWQVPWGKHHPFQNRTNHYAGKFDPASEPHHENLPVVTIRDPYTWLQSMCRQPYGAQYNFAKETCPNLIPYPGDIAAHPRFAKIKYIPVHVKYDKRLGISRKYDSMGHLWNEWYEEYIKIEGADADTTKYSESITMKSPTVPLLVVRMEDLVFHAKTVLPQLCECVGGGMKHKKVRYISSIQNMNHGIDKSEGAGLLRSVVNYGNITRRRNGFADFQLAAAKEILDPRLMTLMGYRYEKP